MGSCSSSQSQNATHTNFETYDGIDPLSYIPDDPSNIADIRNPNRIVSHVHVVADALIKTGGNHWVIFLETSGESVRLDMVPGAYPGQNGYLGRLDIQLQKDIVTRTKHFSVVVPATEGHSVADFLDAIVARCRHRYVFTAEGRGCTGWVRDQFYLFVKAGLLLQGWEKQVESAIHSTWNEGSRQGSRTVTTGRYPFELRGRGIE